MKEDKKFMIGNLVKINNKIHKITLISESDITARDIESGDLSVYTYDQITPIRLSDDFFRDNGYIFDNRYSDRHERYVTHIVPGEYAGPAVTKYEYESLSSQETEYCVTGIIIRTIDEFQNIMNICHCSFISDKIIAK
jgi:hypothetical protein